MKKIIAAFLIVLTVTPNFAQDNNGNIEHMKFNGIPIDGTLKEFILKMKERGFEHIETEDGVAILKGDFAAYKGCFIGVVTLKNKDLVSKITVIFPEKYTWTTLSSNYYNLKELLTEKYGVPTENVEKWNTDSEPDDDDKMFEVKMDNCKYYTIYETENGNIELSIGHINMISCFVILSYFDKVNTKKIKEKAIDDL